MLDPPHAEDIIAGRRVKVIDTDGLQERVKVAGGKERYHESLTEMIVLTFERCECFVSWSREIELVTKKRKIKNF